MSTSNYIDLLDKSWQATLRRGIAPNTFKQYSTGQKHYLDFCFKLNIPPLPATEICLLRFVTSIKDNLRGSTIQNYLSAVRFLHIMNGYGNPLPDFERLKLVVKALKRESGPTRQRAPITFPMLKSNCRLLKFTVYEDVLFWAMALVGFFGFMRVSEFTVPYQFNPDLHLTLQDLSLSKDFSSAQLRLKASKTDPFRRGYGVVFGSTSDAVCPILAILLYLNLRTSVPGPLFMRQDGRPATRAWFCNRLKDAIIAIGVPGNISSHSLRIGAATAAAAAGIPHATIQVLGRWTSDAYKSYVRMTAEQKGAYSKCLLPQG